MRRILGGMDKAWRSSTDVTAGISEDLKKQMKQAVLDKKNRKKRVSVWHSVFLFDFC